MGWAVKGSNFCEMSLLKNVEENISGLSFLILLFCYNNKFLKSYIKIRCLLARATQFLRNLL